MWLLFSGEPRPDAPYWPGRRLLSAIDAVTWPFLWAMVFAHAPEPVGIVGPFVAAASFLSGLGRLRRALWLNHRYRFTTWRWARVVVAMLVAGAVLKLTLPT